MYRQFFANLDSAALPLLAMFLFMAAFALVLMRLFVRGRRRDFDSVAGLPLAHDRLDPLEPQERSRLDSIEVKR
jgi:hypothetical protein